MLNRRKRKGQTVSELKVKPLSKYISTDLLSGHK